MAQFNYQGVDKSGKRVNGKLDAQNEGDVRMLLRGQGIRPTSVAKPAAMNTDIMSLFRKAVADVPLAVVLNFTRQFQVLIGAGIPLVQGLEMLADQTPGSFKSIILIIKDKVSQGAFLWESLAQYPTIFPKLYIALVRAGESSGSLDQMLKRLGRYLEDSERIKKQVKGAMMYPIIVTTIGIGVVALMVIFVIPKFEDMLKGSGKELPGPTKFLIEVSHLMIRNLYPIVAVSTVVIFLSVRYFKSEEGRAFLDRVVFFVPVFGPMAQKSGVARFTRTMQTLLVSGVNLLDAIDICKNTIDNRVLEDAMVKIRSEVEGGKTLGMVVGKITIFPKMASQMIAVGEQTGNLDKMLEKVADLYEDEVEELAGSLGKAIEPFVIVFLGAMVGGIMIAMYLPVFQMAGGAD